MSSVLLLVFSDDYRFSHRSEQDVNRQWSRIYVRLDMGWRDERWELYMPLRGQYYLQICIRCGPMGGRANEDQNKLAGLMQDDCYAKPPILLTRATRQTGVFACCCTGSTSQPTIRKFLRKFRKHLRCYVAATGNTFVSRGFTKQSMTFCWLRCGIRELSNVMPVPHAPVSVNSVQPGAAR